jgi:2-polyprenyl-6-methoxyphenol hydroxylase-like FAD-dependent oxidoreductase
LRDSTDGSAQETDETLEVQPVLIVGAGPTGLLLAAELMRRGVPCHLIDAQPAPLHWNRATVLHSRSLQIFESLGTETTSGYAAQR